MDSLLLDTFKQNIVQAIKCEQQLKTEPHETSRTMYTIETIVEFAYIRIVNIGSEKKVVRECAETLQDHDECEPVQRTNLKVTLNDEQRWNKATLLHMSSARNVYERCEA